MNNKKNKRIKELKKKKTDEKLIKNRSEDRKLKKAKKRRAKERVKEYKLAQKEYKLAQKAKAKENRKVKKTKENKEVNKSKKTKKGKWMPAVPALQAELDRVLYKQRYRSVLKSTVYTLITVAAIAILVATLWLPVLQIYGSSMSPILHDGDIVVTVKTSDFEHGDVVSFYYNNKILVKRVIAVSGEWVNIDIEGNVYVNGTLLEEPYLESKAFGDCNIELPYQVPDGKVFVIGDNRATSVDSRNTAVGCVSQEQIVGKIMFRVWPLNSFGELEHGKNTEIDE